MSEWSWTNTPGPAKFVVLPTDIGRAAFSVARITTIHEGTGERTCLLWLDGSDDTYEVKMPLDKVLEVLGAVQPGRKEDSNG